MSEATARKMSSQTTESVQDRIRARTRTQADTGPNISGNTFYKIIMDPNLSPEDKKSATVQALAFSETKEENRARMREFESFKEYMHAISERMSRERISLTDTEVFAELQKNYGQLNDDLEDFFNKIKPLTDITDALYTLRTEGKTRDALAQIREDKEWVEEIQAKRRGLQDILDDLDASLRGLAVKNAQLETQRSLFGFGGIKAEAAQQIAANKLDIEKYTTNRDQVLVELEEIQSAISEREASMDNAFEIQKLRELLDLNSEQHTKRQADMVASALAFVNSGKERFGSIRQHLDKMVLQIDGLGDNNNSMLQITAILNEATKEAEIVNQHKRSEYVVPEGASLIEKMRADELRQDIDEHIDVLATSAVDTMQTFGELTAEAIKIRNMHAATKKQVESARSMHSRGIASVASQLSTVLQAVNAAGINESQQMASSTLAEMARVTNSIAQKEAIRIATSRDDINHDLELQLQALMEYGDTQREATEITREALTTMRSNLSALEEMSKSVQGDTKEFVSVAADVVNEHNSVDMAEKVEETTNTAFKF